MHEVWLLQLVSIQLISLTSRELRSHKAAFEAELVSIQLISLTSREAEHEDILLGVAKTGKVSIQLISLTSRE